LPTSRPGRHMQASTPPLVGSPLLRLTFAHPLEATDLWKLQQDRKSQHIADKINERCVLAAKEFSERLETREIRPGLKGIWRSIRGNRAEREKEWREANKKPSLIWA
jgi:hypothetical protein